MAHFELIVSSPCFFDAALTLDPDGTFAINQLTPFLLTHGCGACRHSEELAERDLWLVADFLQGNWR